MNLWKSIAGIVEVELTSADLAQSFEAICGNNIAVFQVRSITNLTAHFRVFQKDLISLHRLCEKRGESLKVISRKGVYWTFRTLLHRPIFCVGILCLFLSAIYIPRHIFFVEVQGNSNIPSNRILEAAEDCGIYFGASRSAVRSERVKNALLSNVPELQWAGVNTRGCVAVISVRERTAAVEESQPHLVSSIVAERDGVILSCTATKGNLVCTQGQAVQAGELLISGYTDCGLSIQATSAQGEIIAQTMRELTVSTPIHWQYHGEQREDRYTISLVIGKKRIFLWKDSGIWDATCGRMYKEYYITLPGGFQLPFALCIDSCTVREPLSGILDTDIVAMQEFAKQYLRHQMIAGEILEAEQTFEETEELCVLQGRYFCREMIGRVKPEKMGEEDE